MTPLFETRKIWRQALVGMGLAAALIVADPVLSQTNEPPQAAPQLKRPSDAEKAHVEALRINLNKLEWLRAVSQQARASLVQIDGHARPLLALHASLRDYQIGPGSKLDRFTDCSRALIAKVSEHSSTIDALLDAERHAGQLQAKVPQARKLELRASLKRQAEAASQRETLHQQANQQLDGLEKAATSCASGHEELVRALKNQPALAQNIDRDLVEWISAMVSLETELQQLRELAAQARTGAWPDLRDDQLPPQLGPGKLRLTPPLASDQSFDRDYLLHVVRQGILSLNGIAKRPIRSMPPSPWPDVRRAHHDGHALLDDMLQALTAQAYLRAVKPQGGTGCSDEACLSWRKESALVGQLLQKRESAWQQLHQSMLDQGKTAYQPAQALLQTMAESAADWQSVDNTIQLVAQIKAEVYAPIVLDLNRFEADLAQAIQVASQRIRQAEQAATGADDDFDPPGGGFSASPPAASVAQPATPTSSGARFGEPIADHSHQLMTRLDQEYPGFGTYTYVLLRAQDDWNKPKVRARVLRLLGYLTDETPEGGTVPQAARRRFNLFVLPSGSSQSAAGKKPTNNAVNPSEYNSLLGHAIKARIQSGLVLQESIRKALLKQPGPFLLTLPATVKTMNPSSAAVFADLSTVPVQTINDVARQYMSGLVASLPDQQKRWTPPGKLKFAMTLISLADDASGFAYHLFPGAEAQAKGR